MVKIRRRVALVLMAAAAIPGGLALGAPETPAPAEVVLTIEHHQFQPEELRVKSGQPFVLVITNKDPSVEEFESHDLRIEKVVPGGKTMRLRMPVLKPGTYAFFGDYHQATAKGRLVAE